jgi:proton-dependent oligopeptide transporter, POT family
MTRGAEGTLFGHPKGLVVLFLTEMWERFSFYGMRALLVYYMLKQLTFTQGQASQIYGLYTGLVYLTPLFGGILADRLVGQRKAVILGAALMAFGHFLMVSESLFFPALLLLIFGNGCFKPNISSQVGSLYDTFDPRRDRAFSIFYVGINLGAFFSPLICGTLGELYGWHYGFAAAGVGMVVGLTIYLLGQRWLPPDNFTRRSIAEREAPRRPITEERGRILGLLAICLASVAFWAAYEQQGNTLALWADSDTDRSVFGWVVPASWFQSLNPLFVFLFTPVITRVWELQSKRGSEPTAVSKMAIGCFLMACGFLVMIPAAAVYAGEGISASILWLVAFTFLVTLGELYLSPVGLSLVTKLSPSRMVSMMMGTWFASSFAGNYAAGFLGSYWEKMPKDQFFLTMAGVAALAGVTILAILRPLRRAIGPEYRL